MTMKDFKNKCPFCHKDIPKISVLRTITKHKRHRVKTRTIREVIGEDWAAHVQTCVPLKEFLNKTKDE